MEFVKKLFSKGLCIVLGFSGLAFAEEKKHVDRVMVIGKQNFYLEPCTNTATIVSVAPRNIFLSLSGKL